MYLKFWRSERRAEEERMSAFASVDGEGAIFVDVEAEVASGIEAGDSIV